MNAQKDLTEAEVETFLTKLKAADQDKKVDQIQFFGMQLEEATSIPETTLDAITLSVAPLLKSTSHLLISSTLSLFLPFHLKLIPATSSNHLRLAVVQFLPNLLEKLQDSKERVQTLARQSIIILGLKCYESEGSPSGIPILSSKGKEKESLTGIWERSIREVMSGKGAKGKLECMKIVLAIRRPSGVKVPLKPWLAPLVDLLEDGDGGVRDQARETVVALLQPESTPAAARSELKKLLLARNVRKSIADGILARIFAGPTPETATPPNEDAADALDGPVPKDSLMGTVTPATEEVPVVYIASDKDLEHEFAGMLPFFVGKETEHNWLPREKSIIRIRGMLKGQAHTRYMDAFVAGLKSGLMDGLSRTILSLRTTVAQQSCAVIQELVENLGSSFDRFVEDLLPVLAKLAGLTKKIIAERSQRSTTAIIIHTTPQPKLLINHISQGLSEKNIQCRFYSATHLKTYLDHQASRSKSTIETSNLLEVLDTSVRKALADVNPGVREVARTAFWSYHIIWPSKGNDILNGLDGMARKQLEKIKPDGVSIGNNGAADIPVRPAPKKTLSGMSALLAEKRKAKARELAAEKAGQQQQSPRIFSGPVPGSPMMEQQQNFPRSSSSGGMASQLLTGDEQDHDGQDGSPKPTTGARLTASNLQLKEQEEAMRSSPLRSQTSKAQETIRPQASNGSPQRESPLRNPSFPSKLASSTTQNLQTPTIPRRRVSGNGPSGTAEVGIPGVSANPVPDAMKAQAAQAESAARQLLDFDDASSPTPQLLTPRTPARPDIPHILHNNGSNSVGNGLFGTPLHRGPGGSGGTNIWDDSPAPGPVTPDMLDNLKGRKGERRWWLRQQQVVEQTTPLKSSLMQQSSAVSSIRGDLEALERGTVELRNIQKLTMFSGEHPIASSSGDRDGQNGNGDESASSRDIWETDNLFERLFEGLMGYLQPSKPEELLVHAMVLLWELVQYQFPLLGNHDSMLVEALLRLRACKSPIILEATNSLISLLAETSSNPIILLSSLRSALISFIASHPTSNGTNGTSITNDNNSSTIMHGEEAQTSGYLFGFNGMGMCILRLPKQVVIAESKQLEPLVMSALQSKDVGARQSAQTLILAIQAIIQDPPKTLGLFPELSETQKDLAMYFFEKNGLIKSPVKKDRRGGDAVEKGEDEMEEGKSRVMEELVGLMARGIQEV